MNRKIDPQTLWLVAIKDKELMGEPYIAFAVVEAATADQAAHLGNRSEAIELLAKAGRNRCHAVVYGATDCPFQLDHFYRTSILNPPNAANEIERLEAEVARLRAGHA